LLEVAVALEAQAQKLVAGLVRVAVMAPTDGPEPDHGLPPAHRQVMLLLGRRDREYRLSDLAGDLGSSIAATMALLSPLIAKGLVEMRPAPSYAARDMRVAATDEGLATTPAPANWADRLLSEVETLSDTQQARLLRMVTAKIGLMQQQGSIPVTRMCLSCRFFDGYRHPGTQTPHHCWFVDAPFGYRELRLHCADHIPGDPPRPAA
jgi:DNA-binding MarR family transcriptional regulator